MEVEINVIAKPLLGFPGGWIDYYRGTRKECLEWAERNHYTNEVRYELRWEKI
jgi:hypothetical protein